ncbi:hypothetical protein Ae706Ps2_6663c [Pseudonocardia sp. Ae706_Ps2]|uniref:hypothetical protein n=1 Tax=Pseudonocardia sp. Ae707_Ps2 TaxID=2212992 RepID=UPI00094B39A8|nr:hypothetical protein Ae505Ps2_6239 [Pseudonocardia sp. Ae505_Ps2]OLM08772.1 hypothetical protein Ae706Ps2_6617 [Pseudonocardia sp. Ae706_Ps2]OLM08806.1 hypothetical protein Ae706Ps2_6651c [Pseudonocardia sp. Ae706_Ps2]OLM08816.1 hypothetical protein Ae706Ps2_6661c [Pseudonocardia sp. Ae706_Ps2]OLM08818.1 hypothetical protein Ae706Ps2_6663c [Pseudonocardia sp. Ae706_Ps2]
MNALLRTTARGLADRAAEITIVGGLGAATMCLTWWFTIPTVLATVWWASVEVRLRRAHRAAPASNRAADLPSTATRSAATEPPPAPVSAGQTGAGRAGA